MIDEELTWLPGWRLRELLVARELSVTEVTEHFLERIAELDRSLNSFITVVPDVALEQARAAERRLAAGAQPGPLFGLPLSIKDLYYTKDIRTTGGSLIYRNFVPPEDSVHAERARAAGAVIMGKTNTPEFGLFPRTTNRLLAECVNPWDYQRTCGGSSGGAAASVAAGLTPVAIGSDGGGSIRIPAALCGVYGLHPSNGRVPRHGGLGGSLFFSAAGPMTRDVRDAATLLGVLAGADPRDPSCRKDVPPDYLTALDEGVAGRRALWVSDCGDVDGLDARVIDAAATAALRFEELGATVEQSTAGLDGGEFFEAFYVIMNADRYALLGQGLYEDPSARGLLSAYGRDHFGAARGITAVEYSRAMQARFRLIDRLERMFEPYDFLLTPTVGVVAPRLSDPIPRQPLVAYTFLVNYSGFTAATIPCGLVDGMPAGLQIIGRPNDEAMVLTASRAFERAHPPARPVTFLGGDDTAARTPAPGAAER